VINPVQRCRHYRFFAHLYSMGLFDTDDTSAAAPRVWTVSALNRRVQAILEEEPDLRNLRLEAEVSNYKRHSSGHLYFTLKDADSQLSAVMWRSAAERNAFQHFADGDRVQVRGSITVYPPRGQYQLQVERMTPAGVGELYKRLERLRTQLQAEGLFDPDRKRPLPPRPARVAVITSPTGAVVQDVIRTLRVKHARLTLLVVPAAVQGAEAVPALLRALALVPRLNADVAVVARGGGSLEDLWAFNEEPVVRAVAACPIPIISAVGHETDFTLADFAADVRAATPTAAAQLLAPDLEAELGELAYYHEAVVGAMQNELDYARQSLDDFAHDLTQTVQQALAQRRQALAQASYQLATRALLAATQQQGELARLDALLQSLNPQQVLNRGYTLTYKDGKQVRTAKQIHQGDNVEIAFADGRHGAQIHSK
jgi:exodeoxyribonuclease VII large subunit